MSKGRSTIFAVLILMGLACGLSILRIRAANPTSGSINPNSSSPVIWDGTMAGGAYNGEAWRQALCEFQ